ncbi:MAG: methyltransferase domain-containing protein [Planctomycetes bacterium]|nr:methyltransferase domain-containing protein [Planctomycetota bacterium]
MAGELPLDRMPASFQEARILMTAVELGVFDAIGRAGCTAAAIATAVRADPRTLRRLLDALVAIGILRKRAGSYRIAPAARGRLLRGSPGSMLDMYRHHARLWETWSGLTEVVRTGRMGPRRPRSREDQEAFSRAMADIARGSARQTARVLDLRGARQLVDLGGAPGIYGIAFARKHPGLTVTVIDLPEAGPITRRTAREAGLAARVRFRPGDVRHIPTLGSRLDCVFFSNLIHSFRPNEVRALVAKAARALRPGGRIAIKDFWLDEDRAGPRHSALFSINMLVASGGDCYTRGEIETWLRDAGFEAFDWTPVAETSRIVTARRATAPPNDTQKGQRIPHATA